MLPLSLLSVVLPGQLGQKSAAGVTAGFEWRTAGSGAWGQGICKRQQLLAASGFQNILPRDKAQWRPTACCLFKGQDFSTPEFTGTAFTGHPLI